MHRIACTTKFDITATGVRSHFKETRMPFVDSSGEKIIDQMSWTRARNQQSNWETINQVISLRTLPENISDPVYDKQTETWGFEFDVINIESISLDTDILGALLRDCNGVPMILGLYESKGVSNVLSTSGADTNIWFDVIDR